MLIHPPPWCYADTADSCGVTPLHAAAMSGSVACVNLLLNAKASTSAVAYDGRFGPSMRRAIMSLSADGTIWSLCVCHECFTCQQHVLRSDREYTLLAAHINNDFPLTFLCET